MMSPGTGKGNEGRWVSESKEIFEGQGLEATSAGSGQLQKSAAPLPSPGGSLKQAQPTSAPRPPVPLPGDLRNQSILWGVGGEWKTGVGSGNFISWALQLSLQELVK